MSRTVKSYIVAVLALGGALSQTMCGGGGTGGSSSTTGACPNGICGTGAGGSGGSATSSSGSTGTSSGTTSSSSSSGSSGTTSSSSSSSGSSGTTSSSSSSSGSTCVEAWLCTPWDTGGSGDAAQRSCVDTNNCGTTADKPATSATLPALDVNYFKCNVQPILDNRCSMLGCHGTETGRALRVYGRGRLRNAGENVVSVASASNGQCGGTAPGASCIGSFSCPCNAPHTATEWQRNYDAARGFALDAAGNPIASGSMASSELIHQPVVGGAAHAGIHLFRSGDAEYTTLMNWLGGATLATCNTGLN